MNALIFEVFGHVRAAAEIDEVRSQGVLGEDLAGALFDQLALHPGVGVLFEAFVLAGVDALVGQVARLDLPHLLLDLFQIVGGEGRGAVEIVIEAVLDGRADAELGFGIQFQHGGGQQVRGGVAVDLERFGVLGGEDLEAWRPFRCGRVRSYSSPLTLATIAASARRGLIDCAISMGLVPAATDCLLPSGRVISMLLIGKFQRST